MTNLEAVYIMVGIAVGVISIVAGLAGGIRWMVKYYLAELKPNSGSSLKDQVNRMESRLNQHEAVSNETYKRVERLENKIDSLYTKIIDIIK
jgi:hypothetical protein